MSRLFNGSSDYLQTTSGLWSIPQSGAMPATVWFKPASLAPSPADWPDRSGQWCYRIQRQRMYRRAQRIQSRSLAVLLST